MKRISDIFKILILIVSVVLCVYLYQIETSKTYDLINSYQVNRTMRIPEGVPVDKELLDLLQGIADKHDVVIEKKISTVENGKMILSHYTNIKKDKLNQILKQIEWTNEVSDSYNVSTLKEDKYNGYIKDFLENDYHRYTLLDNLKEETYLGGGYTILADNENKIQSFFKEVSSLMGLEDETSLYGGFQESIYPYTFVFASYFIVIFILLFMVTLFMTFDAYNKSKKFGIYKLCGYDTFEIIKLQLKKDILFYTSFLAIATSIILLIIPHITFKFLLLLFSMIITISLVNICLYSIITKLMLKKVRYNDLLKNRSLTNIMTHVAVIFKSASVGILTLGFVFASMFYTLTKDQLDQLNQFSRYSDYGFFESFDIGEDQSSLTNSRDSELSKGGELFYKEMYNQGGLYADFGDFKENIIKQNDLFIANVDTNYLNEFNISSPQGKNIHIDADSEKFYYLIPTTKMDKLDEIQSLANKRHKGIQIDFIEYKDRKFPTLSPNIAADSEFMIDAPIIKVLTLGNVSSENILSFGGYYDTPLKFKIIESKEAMFNNISPILDKCGLSDNLKLKHLVTYEDLFGKEINSKMEQLSMLVTILVVLLFVIISVSFQSILLYLKGNSKEIAVKKFIGISSLSIFIKFVIENIVIMGLCFIIIGIIFRNQVYLPSYIPFALGMIILDIAIIFLNVKIKLRSFIIKTLKGDQL